MTAAKNVREALEEVLAAHQSLIEANWARELDARLNLNKVSDAFLRIHGPALLALLSATAAGDAKDAERHVFPPEPSGSGEGRGPYPTSQSFSGRD